MTERPEVYTGFRTHVRGLQLPLPWYTIGILHGLDTQYFKRWGPTPANFVAETSTQAAKFASFLLGHCITEVALVNGKRIRAEGMQLVGCEHMRTYELRPILDVLEAFRINVVTLEE